MVRSPPHSNKKRSHPFRGVKAEKPEFSSHEPQEIRDLKCLQYNHQEFITMIETLKGRMDDTTCAMYSLLKKGEHKYEETKESKEPVGDMLNEQIQAWQDFLGKLQEMASEWDGKWVA